MPFKSEAQRRYLWANEPEIARDWTDTYGSKIHAANGGIMRLPFAEGDIVDDMGNIYEDRDLKYQHLSEEQFNEEFGEEETAGIGGIEGIKNFATNVKDKFTGGVDYMKKLPSMAMGALIGNPYFSLAQQAFKGQQLTPQQIAMNKQFFQTGNMGRPVGIGTQQNPFQMTSGPFQGMNAPGTSAFGSKDVDQMATKWLNRYGHTAPIEKVHQMSALAGKDTPTPGQMGGSNMGMPQGGEHKAPGGSGYGPHSSGGAHGGKNYGPYSKAKGGLISLWPK